MIVFKQNKVAIGLDCCVLRSGSARFSPVSNRLDAGLDSGSQRNARDLERIFANIFKERYQTVLLGGEPEPVYYPQQSCGATNRIYYREDFFASALHEVAHWCIAGKERRQQTDYGYWYAPDGRTVMQQQAFELAEQKPQALEWIFSIACGWQFCLSADNLNAHTASSDQSNFARAVKQAALAYCDSGMPDRAGYFFEALSHFYRGDQLLSLSAEVHDIVRTTQLLSAGN